MEKKHAKRGTAKTSSKTELPFGNLEIAGLFLDTSWRVAIPILALTLTGHWLDTKHQTTPIFVVIGLLLSIALSSYLIYIQLKSAFPDMFGGKKS